MQIRMKDQLSADEALMLLEVANAEAASLRQQLAEAHQIIQRREAVIKILESDIEAIGAGGVSLMGGSAMKWDTPEALVAYLRDNPTSDAMRAAADEIERLRAALTTAREYVSLALEHERDAYKGFEHVSDIEQIERDLTDIDAALWGDANG